MPQSILAQFLHGFAMPLRALGWLCSHRGVKRYAILPFLTALLFYALIVAAAAYAIGHWDWGAVRFEFLGAWLHEKLAGFMNVLKWIVLLPVLIACAYFSFSAVGLVIASPLNDLLSERIELELCGPKERLILPFNKYLRGMGYSIWDSFTILLRQVFFTALTVPLLLVPVVGFLPFFLVCAYYTGRGYFEVGTARNLLRPKHSRSTLRALRWQLLGLGVAIQLLFSIPFMPLFILPLGITAGTLMYCAVDWEAALRESRLEPPLGFQPPKPKPKA
ncbi:MAG: EI24 domain-containing protein [Planctomycetes bacterium]|nr:EI24 domain-containing protein [Planctomycetota bacterium]